MYTHFSEPLEKTHCSSLICTMGHFLKSKTLALQQHTVKIRMLMFTILKSNLQLFANFTTDTNNRLFSKSIQLNYMKLIAITLETISF